jgi:indole-3-glycerol phosphate synthase
MEISSREKTILDRIVDARRESVAHRKRVLPDVALKMAVQKAEPPRDFAAALTRGTFNIIAELKKASPSLGIIREHYVPGELVPILRKDFIFDPWQVWEARAAGADTFLLIAAVLTDGALRELLELGRSLEMEPLVEVHSRAELDRTIAAGAKIIGINNRDLRDFAVRLETSLELIESIPDDCIAVSESGLHTHEDLVRLRSAGFDAFLIGETVMKAADPGESLSHLIGSGGAAVA